MIFRLFISCLFSFGCGISFGCGNGYGKVGSGPEVTELFKGIIQRGTLYIVVKEASDEGEVLMLKAYEKGNPYPKITYFNLGYYVPHPLCWDIDGEYIYTSEIKESLSRGIYRFDRYPLETRDSLEYIRFIESEYEKNKKKYQTEEEMRTAMLQDVQKEGLAHNPRFLSPAKYLYQAYQTLSRSELPFDILKKIRAKDHFIDYNYLSKGPNSMEFYIKDFRQLTLWEYQYPDRTKEGSFKNWREIRTWCVDTLEIVLGKHNEETLPSISNSVFNAIYDSSFLEHHFEVVKQAEETFLINTVNGHI